MFVHKPFLSPGIGKWVVVVKENRSPMSDTVERMEFTSREAAWQAYRHAMSELK